MASTAPRQRNQSQVEFIEAGRSFIDRTTDRKQAIQGLLKQAAAMSGSGRASLYLVDGGVLKPHVLYNIPDEYLAGCREVPLGTQCCGRAALHAHPWIVEDMWTDPLFSDCAEAAKASGMRSAFSIPVMTDDRRVLGSVGFQFETSHRPDAQELERAGWFAELIAYALR